MFHVPNKFRITHGAAASDDSIGNNGAFGFTIDGKHLWVIASDGECFVPLRGYENFYEISNFGKIKSLNRITSLPNGAKRNEEEKILKHEITEKGYPRVCLNKGHREMEKKLVHVLVAEHFIENPNQYTMVNHIDGDPTNCIVNNLEWCNRSYNIHHAIENELQTGLKTEDIILIKEMLDKNISIQEIANLYNRSRQTISDIKSGRHRNLNPDTPSKYKGISLWEHVSVSKKNKCPSWEEMCLIKSYFWDEEDVVIQYHPRRSEYVNNHKHCLHMWRPIGIEIPTPPINLIGLK